MSQEGAPRPTLSLCMSNILFCCFCVQPRNKGQQITVITFGRAGEDNKSFKLTNIDSTIAGFAGADYDM